MAPCPVMDDIASEWRYFGADYSGGEHRCGEFATARCVLVSQVKDTAWELCTYISAGTSLGSTGDFSVAVKHVTLNDFSIRT